MKKLIYGMFACVVVLGIALLLTMPKDSGRSSSGSSSGSSGSHTCYVCGKSGNLKYGSHYYCKTHWAMVKTVDEAD